MQSPQQKRNAEIAERLSVIKWAIDYLGKFGDTYRKAIEQLQDRYDALEAQLMTEPEQPEHVSDYQPRF